MTQNPHTHSAPPTTVTRGFGFRHLFRGPRVLPALLPGLVRGHRRSCDELDERAELGHEALAGRADLRRLRGAAAEPYLQGLDVIECRGERLMEVLAVRTTYGQRNPWRLSPQRRAARRLPDTPAGRRQKRWLETLERAGLITAPGRDPH